MLTETALNHFNNSRIAIARVLGLTKSAVHQWGVVVPKASAENLQKITGGKLKVDPSLYNPKTLHPIYPARDKNTTQAA